MLHILYKAYKNNSYMHANKTKQNYILWSSTIPYPLIFPPIADIRTVSTVINNCLGMDTNKSPHDKDCFVIMPLPVSENR